MCCIDFSVLMSGSKITNYCPFRTVFNLVSKVFSRFLSVVALLRYVTGQQNMCHLLNQSAGKPKPNMPCSHAFTRVWRRLHIFALISDWFIALFASVVIGQSNYFGFGLTTLKLKPL